MEIYELQRDLDRFFVSADSAYAGYPMGRLMELAQQGDKDARLAEMCNFVKEQDPGYCCMVKVEQSYASALPEEDQ